jgi:ubiquinol-cytochrome c reductase iron-sulfur subunit
MKITTTFVGKALRPATLKPAIKPVVGSTYTSYVSTLKRHYSVTVSKDSNIAPPHNHYTKDLKNYNDQSSRNTAYFMVGAYSMVGAMAAKNIVTDYLQNLSASADVLAMAKVEVAMDSIPLGRNLILKWRGKPVFIRHRTPDEIDEANSVNVNDLIDKQTDAERVKKPEWLVMLGVCTHLGCVPIGEGFDNFT